MATSYSIDPSDFSLERFFDLTVKRSMLPSRIELHDKPEQRLAMLKSEGFQSIKDILTKLKSKEQLSAFSLKTGIPESYLVLLKREAGSYISKPVRLKDFPGIPLEYAMVLDSKGIKNSRHFYEQLQGAEQKQEMSKLTGIPIDRLEELFYLCDLVRINGVGAVYARILYESDIFSVKQFAETDYKKIYGDSMGLIRLKGYPAGHFVESDIEYCVIYAKELMELA